jgi:hypothetical protein
MASYIHNLARIRIIYPLTLLLFIGCNILRGQAPFDLDKVVYQAEDRSMVEEVLSHFTENKEASKATLMVAVGTHFLETPYVAHTLESDKEQLLINVREVDCTTFAEYCLALSRTTQSTHPSFQEFAAELQRIRYRDGVIEGYPSRLHYFCDWIYTNEQKGLIKDMSRDIAQTPLNKTIDFMSKHPDSYKQLKEDPGLVESIAQQEREISKREMYYVPESRVAELENQLMEGDIVGITTGVKGLAISHVGILVKRAGRIHLLHASSATNKVVVSENTLEAYLVNSKSATGIMVARPL